MIMTDLLQTMSIGFLVISFFLLAYTVRLQQKRMNIQQEQINVLQKLIDGNKPKTLKELSHMWNKDGVSI